MRLTILLLMSILVPACSSLAAEPATPSKKLIEFGWDEPDTAFMRKHVDQLERSPFDGCVFHIAAAKPDGGMEDFLWQSWGKRAFTEDQFRHAIDDLKQTPFKRFRHNFLRFNTTPADVDWFDDHSAILNNARLAARVAKEGGCPGLLFDIEQYNAPLFTYEKQRDAKTKSWEAYAAQARLRGREVMRAFQEGYPGLTVFLTFGYCLPYQDSHPNKPLAECGYGLSAPPFLDGLLEAAEGRTRFIDGNESAYSYMETKRFLKGRRMIKEDLVPMVVDPEKYRRLYSVSFGLWLDYDWRNAGWVTDDLSKNVHTPEEFEVLVRQALQTADEYVWIYSETPRWWSAEGGPVKLPGAYDAAIRRAYQAANTASRPATAQ